MPDVGSTEKGLFVDPIERVAWTRETKNRRVPSSVNETTIVIDGNERIWVQKWSEDNNSALIFNESIAWHLGQRMGVLMPTCAVDTSGASPRWLSELVDDAQRWSSANAVYASNPESLGAMLALDVLILNEDRHAGNILMQADGSPINLRCWAIDHDGAMVADPARFESQIEHLPSTGSHADLTPSPQIEKGARLAVERVQELEFKELVGMTEDAASPTGVGFARPIAELLERRLGCLSRLVEAHLKALGAT